MIQKISSTHSFVKTAPCFNKKHVRCVVIKRKNIKTNGEKFLTLKNQCGFNFTIVSNDCFIDFLDV